MDWKLELVVVPVTDVDRAKQFYAEQLGFVVDVDDSPTEGFRVVQLTPPGSACSISIGKGLTEAVPGTLQGMQLCVGDIDAAHAQLVERGVDVTPIRHVDQSRAAGRTARAASTTRSSSSRTPTATAGPSRRARCWGARAQRADGARSSVRPPVLDRGPDHTGGRGDP